MALDERLREEIERTARPADPAGVYEDLIRRRERRRIAGRLQSGALAAVVVFGSIAGLYGLSRVFDGGEPPPVGAGSSAARITYVVQDEGPGDLASIYSVRPDGTDRVALADDAPLPSYLDWSSDGRLVYGWGDLFVLDPATGRSTRIAGPDAYGPSWSPDGNRIVFATDTRGRDAIVAMDADGTNRTILFEGHDDVGWTDWSPDGSKILFAGPGPDGHYQGWDIYVMDADGSNVANLTNSPAIDLDPDWSPDGSTILFSSSPEHQQEPNASRDLYLMAPDGSNVRQLTVDEGEHQSPVWSPDGTRIAFTHMSQGEDTDVYTMLADGTGRERILEADAIMVAWGSAFADPIDERTPEPSPSPATPTPDAAPRDLGLGYPVCNVTSIEGEFVESGVSSTVFVATKEGDTGGCPQPEDAFNVITLDVDGDGLADSSFGPIECTLECRAFSWPDVDGDGTGELLVVQDGGAVVGVRLYDVVSADGDPAIQPVYVADPGDPDGGFVSGEQGRFLLGGDAFELYGLRCGALGPTVETVLIATSAESLPNDSPDARWHAHETMLALRDDGQLHVVDVRDFTEPVTADPSGPSFRSGETLCGANLGP